MLDGGEKKIHSVCFRLRCILNIRCLNEWERKKRSIREGGACVLLNTALLISRDSFMQQIWLLTFLGLPKRAQDGTETRQELWSKAATVKPPVSPSRLNDPGLEGHWETRDLLSLRFLLGQVRMVALNARYWLSHSSFLVPCLHTHSAFRAGVPPSLSNAGYKCSKDGTQFCLMSTKQSLFSLGSFSSGHCSLVGRRGVWAMAEELMTDESGLTLISSFCWRKRWCGLCYGVLLSVWS